MRRCGSEKYLRLSKQGDKKHADTTRVSACFFYGDSLVLFCRVCGCRVRCRLCGRERRGQQILIAFDSLLQCLLYTAFARTDIGRRHGHRCDQAQYYDGNSQPPGEFFEKVGGLTHAQDMATFANLFVPERQSYGNLFDVLNDTVTMWTVGADLEGRISGAFGIEASVQYKGFSKKRFDHVSGVPNFTGRLDLRYSIRDKMILTAGATLQSSRWFALSGREIMMSLPELIWQQVGTTVDVHFGAEYRISKAVGVFLQGNNLANQKLYPYYFYRGLGINVLAGVKLVF